jgi:hypothetical protein
VNTEIALAEPASGTRPAAAQGPRGIARVRSGIERAWWDSLEYAVSARQRHVGALVYSGAEKHSGAPLRLLYVGSGNHLAYLRDLAYRECRLESGQDGLPAWDVRKLIAAHEPDADLVVADLPWPWHRLLRGRGYLEVPAWINQRFRLPERWADVFPRLRRSARGEDMRNIRKSRLQARLVRDEAAIRRFYEDLYVPHLKRRFGEAAYIEPEWKIRYCVESGTLMEIHREGELMAAQVLWGSRGSLHFLWSGLTREEYGRETRGAFPALYYYGIVHAFENGFAEADYCGSRPVLADGIFQLKRRWGASVHDGWSRDTLFIRPRRLSGACLELLGRSPLIVRDAGGLAGRVLCGAAPAGFADVERAVQAWASDGIREIAIFSLLPPTPGALAAARESLGVRIVDLSSEANPAAAYARC